MAVLLSRGRHSAGNGTAANSNKMLAATTLRKLATIGGLLYQRTEYSMQAKVAALLYGSRHSAGELLTQAKQNNVF